MIEKIKIDSCTWCKQYIPCQCPISVVSDLNERISCIEIQLRNKELKNEIEKVQRWVESLSTIELRLIDKINDIKDSAIHNKSMLLNDMKGIKDIIKELTEANMNQVKTPYKCPVCNGKGGFYISGEMHYECHPCKGEGIIWG